MRTGSNTLDKKIKVLYQSRATWYMYVILYVARLGNKVNVVPGLYIIGCGCFVVAFFSYSVSDKEEV